MLIRVPTVDLDKIMKLLGSRGNLTMLEKFADKHKKEYCKAVEGLKTRYA